MPKPAAPGGPAGILGGAKLKKRAPPPPREKPPDPFDCPKDGCSVGTWLNQGRFADETLAGPKWLEQVLAAHADVKCVLLDFFAYSCTNCVRTVGGIQQLHATYGPKGLLVVAMHRPEFDFERDPANLAHFLEAKGVAYVVGMDNDDAAWSAWDVSMWPTHYLVQRDPKAAETGRAVKKAYFNGNQALFVGDSQINHGHLERLICKLTGTPEPPGLPGAEDPDPPHALDMEVFLGKLHQYKNVDTGAGSSCGEGACVVHRPADVTKAELVDGTDTPAASGFTVYGAAWCRFCRAAKLLLAESGIAFRYVDVEGLGGPAAVIDALEVSQRTIPIVYSDGAHIGGYDALCAQLGPKKVAERRKSFADQIGGLFQQQPKEQPKEQPKATPKEQPSEPEGGGAAWEAAGALDAEAHAVRVARCTDAARSSELKFERRGDLATISMGHGWGIQDERAIARADDAAMTVVATFGSGHGDKPVTVYVVGGPDVGGEKGGTKLKTGEGREVKTPVANRHYVGTVQNGGSIDLTFEIGFCVYVVYLTSEPPADA